MKKIRTSLLEQPWFFALLSLGLGIIGQVSLYYFKNIPAGLLLFTFAIMALVIAERKSGGKDVFFPVFNISRRAEMIIFWAVISLAAFMRLYKLDAMPAGCFIDEALNGMAGQAIDNGDLLPAYIGPQPPNNASLFMYYIAVVFKFFGAGAAQVRLTSAITGIMAVSAFYFLIRYIAGPAAAITGAFIMAVMRWHIVFSRIGFHAALSVLVVLLALYFAFRVYKERKLPDFILLGLTLSFSVYTYQAARLAPFFLLAFAIYIFIREKGFIRKNGYKILVLLAAAFIVFLPMGNYISHNYESFFNRQGQVSVFYKSIYNPIEGPYGGARALLKSVIDNMLMFNYRGDSNYRHNLSGQPELDFFTGAFAFIGFGYAVTRFFQPLYFFFIAAFFTFMSAGFFTIESPQSLRTILAIPGVVFFILVFIGKFLSAFSLKKAPWLPPAAIACMLVFSAAQGFDIYFNRMARDPLCWESFSTQEYSAGRTARSALLKNWSASVAPFYMKQPSFTFALNGLTGCVPFSLASIIPEPMPEATGLMYILPVEYTSLTGFFKELFPTGALSFFSNPYNGNELFFCYAAPGRDLRNADRGLLKNSVDITCYEEKGFQGKSIRQKMPFIILTWFDNPGFNVSSAFWRARLKTPVSGEYNFHLSSRGYSWFYIDKKPVLVNSQKAENCDITVVNTAVYLKKGVHEVEVRYEASGYIQGSSCSGLWLLWKKPGDGDMEMSVMAGKDFE